MLAKTTCLIILLLVQVYYLSGTDLKPGLLKKFNNTLIFGLI